MPANWTRGTQERIRSGLSSIPLQLWHDLTKSLAAIARAPVSNSGHNGCMPILVATCGAQATPAKLAVMTFSGNVRAVDYKYESPGSPYYGLF